MEEIWNWITETFDQPWKMVVATLVASGLVAVLLDLFLTRLLPRLVKGTQTDIDDEIVRLAHRPVITSAVLVGLNLCAGFLKQVEDSSGEVAQGILSETQLAFTSHVLGTIGLFVWSVFAFRSCPIVLRGMGARKDSYRMIEGRTFPLFDNLSKVLLFGATIYAVIKVWGWDATGWVASASICGLALSFAAKDSLANLFAGVFIIADAPYALGDFINLDSGERGQVVQIGLRSTRLLTRDDIEVTIPNSVMGGARIINETRGRSSQTRVRVKVGVAYGSDLERVSELLLECARAHEQVCQDPEPRVRFRSFGESGLDLQLLCWIPEPVLRGQVLHALNLAVYKRFGEEGIEIPFPQRDVHVKSLPAAGEG